MADWKYGGETDTTKSKISNKITLLRVKLRMHFRTLGFLIFLLGVYHFFQPYFGGVLPVWEIYATHMPSLVAVADGGGIFDAGHALTMAAGAIIVWWL